MEIFRRSFALLLYSVAGIVRKTSGIFPLTVFGGKNSVALCGDVISVTGPRWINRENVQRKLVVSANVAGRDVGSAVADIRRLIASEVSIPENYHISYGGQFESAQSASRMLLLTSILAILIIFIILFRNSKALPFPDPGKTATGSYRRRHGHPVYLRDAKRSPIIGFITLFGIATRNGILLVSRYRALSCTRSLRESVIFGSSDRLNPILMTALASALALIPLALGGMSPEMKSRVLWPW